MKNIKLNANKYLTDQISEDTVKEWNSKKVVLDCPTGMGKTTLINKVVAKVAGDKNACVLFLSSRTALSNQQLDNLKKIGVENVDVKTYQWLESQLNKENSMFSADNYAFIVCDECHYFTNDATFNDNTAISYKWIEQQSTVVYMSATGYTVFKYMNERETVDLNYYANADYSKVGSVTFCHSDEHMIECIENIYNSGDKAIVFMDKMVRNGALGTRVHTPIMEWFLEHQDEAHFMCSKSRKEYESINELDTAIKDGKFENQFLFCTQALEVGIDVKDKECKHVIVELFDTDSVLQCLGRIRDKEDVNYYIRVYDKQTLGGKAQTIKNNFIDKAKELDTLDYDARWNYCMSGTRFNSNKGLFFIDIFDDKKIKVNELLRYKYEDIYEQYMTAMYGNGNEEEMTLNNHPHVSRWMADFNALGFKGEYVDMAELEQQNGKAEITKYLQSIEGVRLDKEGRNELVEKLNVRVDGRQKKTIKPINKWLMENGYDFVIVDKRGIWTIAKIIG